MSQSVRLITGCNPTPDGKTLLLPKDVSGEAVPGKPHVLVTGSNGKKKVLKWSRRADPGEGACVSAGVLSALGGEADVTYRAVGFWSRLFRDFSLLLQGLIALLTLIAACLSAYSTWIKNTTGASATAFDRQTAAVVLIIAAALAILKFIKEVRDL